MSIGFKTSMFGFNKKQVVEYISNIHQSFSEKELYLEENIENLNEDITETNAQKEEVLSKKQELEEKIAEYDEKLALLDKLLCNVEKLNSLAQDNSKQIIGIGEESYRTSTDEVNQNLYSIDEAHISLKNIRDSLESTSSEFAKEVDKLILSLQDTRDKISGNSQKAQKAKDAFEEYIML